MIGLVEATGAAIGLVEATGAAIGPAAATARRARSGPSATEDRPPPREDRSNRDR